MPNKSTLIRTPQQILDRIAELEADDFFGAQRQPLIGSLSYEDAGPFLKGDVSKDEWRQVTDPTESILAYLPVAWDEVTKNEVVGDLFIERFLGWVWLMSGIIYAEIRKSYEDDHDFRRLKQLVLVSERFGFDHKPYYDKIKES